MRKSNTLVRPLASPQDAAATNATPVIRFRGVAKSFATPTGTLQAVRDVNLDVC